MNGAQRSTRSLNWSGVFLDPNARPKVRSFLISLSFEWSIVALSVQLGYKPQPLTNHS
jgi:hypothetical protein